MTRILRGPVNVVDRSWSLPTRTSRFRNRLSTYKHQPRSSLAARGPRHHTTPPLTVILTPPQPSMSGPQLAVVSSQPPSLSDATSTIVCRIPELLRRLRDLEKEEVELNAKARQLVEQFPQTTDAPSMPTRSIISTPVSKLRSRATESTVERRTPSTPPHIDPSMFLSLGLEKSLNVFGRKHRDADESVSVDGVLCVSHVNQKQTQGKDIHSWR